MAEKIPDYSTLELLAGKLKDTRMRSTLSLDEISSKLMIQKRHLEEIEAGSLHFLPKAYVFTYVKKYAEELGVHDQEVFERCRRELQLVNAPQKKGLFFR